MENNENRSIGYYLRALHRDIGFLLIGLTLVYGLSGIVFIYRDTDFLKQERRIERQLSPGIPDSELGTALHLRNVSVVRTEGDVVYFQNGTYDRKTGMASYSDKTLPAWLEKLNTLHRASSRSRVHWFTTLYGVLLLFLALSSFWMFKPGSRLFWRGTIFAAAGFGLTAILLFL
jgi:hypothetical protein